MNSRSVFIIAEAGVNHNGSLDLAKKLVDVAADAGADAVKFQTFKAEMVVSKFAAKADYQKSKTGDHESQFEMIKKLELSEEAHLELVNYCEKKKIMFLSTPFDIPSVDFLEGLGMKIFKIPSGEITNLPYLRKIGRLGHKIILSTGMSILGEIETALNILRAEGAKDITVLHCNTEYPTPMEDVNLKAMLTIGKAFNIPVGYSDHTKGIEVSLATVALGGVIVEKHFTLDRKMKGPDHEASVEPDELKEMVRMIRNIEKAIAGDGIKKLSASESKNKDVARRSIVALQEIKAGEVLSVKNITVKRPGTGISPMEWDRVIGRNATKNYEPDELITW
ncbi:MAG: N-acetylneuraminate synthase [Bacteriovorax sp.]|nr:N-acetylneuraminate synthase [Bacteriovorax sp.]